MTAGTTYNTQQHVEGLRCPPFKTGLVKPPLPWSGLDDLEIATAEWIDWFNRRRQYEYCDDLTPVEAEAAHYGQHQTPATAGVSN
ncbi:hypothetical protein FB381_2603 [Nocardioides albertanoniae]|uniref:Integrase-like protein n=1 Tax=Nocardioides albertanoniae TaxID=1175486 RepID=A0A543A7Z3_9ACTN|nr:hypothetical protein [Nocardioides albertanoniae]TQL68707.1 hypothetical protein FB381_2603 [Nocardioides albertanoniae]